MTNYLSGWERGWGRECSHLQVHSPRIHNGASLQFSAALPPEWWSFKYYLFSGCTLAGNCTQAQSQVLNIGTLTWEVGILTSILTLRPNSSTSPPWLMNHMLFLNMADKSMWTNFLASVTNFSRNFWMGRANVEKPSSEKYVRSQEFKTIVSTAKARETQMELV